MRRAAGDVPEGKHVTVSGLMSAHALFNSRDGTVARALASHLCCLSLIPILVCSWLSPCCEGVFLWNI